MKYYKYLILYTSLTLNILFVFSQTNSNNVLDYDKIYAYSLDANIEPAIKILKEASNLSNEDRLFKANYLKRFGNDTDTETYTDSEDLGEMLAIFRAYWRKSLLNPSENYDRTLAGQIIGFLKKNYPKAKNIEITQKNIGEILSDYIHSKGYYTRDKIDKVGRLIDLVVWKKQEDSLYKIKLDKENITVNVKRLDDFLIMGWNEYATIGKHYSGGWADKKGIYYVNDAYDIKSEAFKISLLAHEARHFKDTNKQYELENYEKEYRAKLTELSLAKKTIYDLINFFAVNTNKESKNPHSVANYMIINSLSESIFKKDFVTDLNKWKSISSKKINKIAKRTLKKDTEERN